MVGIVLVSHSRKLAEGALELARAMGGPEVKLVATGGLDLPDSPLGTDANLVQRAIEEAYSDDGVLVLMDLGSAVLSAELALDALPPEKRSRVRLVDAPLVEGGVAAAVQARLSASLDDVAAEARNALEPKRSHLGEPAMPSATGISEETQPTTEGVSRVFSVRNRLGLHARPAARFVQSAARFQSDLRVRNLTTGRGPVSAKSINAVATLGVRQGHEIEVTAVGPDAKAALDAMAALSEQNFGDEEDGPAVRAEVQRAETPHPPAETTRLTFVFPFPPSFAGIPVSPGIVLGPARMPHPAVPAVPTHLAKNPEAEWASLLTALEKTRRQIETDRDHVAQRASDYAAAIFEAHLLFLDDEALRGPARALIYDEGLNAALAWQRAVERMAAKYRALDDEYMRARADDVLDVGRQVLLNLMGKDATAPVVPEAGVLIAPDLAPAETARLDPGRVMGVCTAFGGPTSHAAILARSLGIPAVVGMGEAVLGVEDGTPIAMDGGAGYVWVSPSPELSAELTYRAEAQHRAAQAARAARQAPAVTRDGRRVEIAANIGNPADALAAVEAGAEAVGLFRTEFLFLDRQTAPDEDEQYAAYRSAAETLAGRPLIIRTLDAGGDKPLPYLDLGEEANPFLGFRAVRVGLARPELFRVQLRAILRVAAEFPVRVMFPMIATLEEFRACRAHLDGAREELRGQAARVPEQIEVGIMVEIPSAALQAEAFADEVEFFSIGTNDLTQYTLAAERGNPRVAALADAFHPAVLGLIHRVTDAAHSRGKWAGVCGEMAGDPLAVPLLLGFGVDELSMSPPAIPAAKQTVRSLAFGDARELALTALRMESARAVREAAGTLRTAEASSP